MNEYLFQQKLTQRQWSESDYDEDGSSSHSEHCTTTTNVPSIESFEFTPQFSPPIVRLFGGLFIHNCEEVLLLLPSLFSKEFLTVCITSSEIFVKVENFDSPQNKLKRFISAYRIT